MLNGKINRVAVLVLASLLTLGAVVPARSQTSSINAYSPYSMFGIGELSTPGALPMRSLGGVGVAWRSSSMASIINPAGYSATARKSLIFDFGFEGMYIDNTQRKYNADNSYAGLARKAKNSINFHEISVQMPLAKGVGFGVSLTPYSSVGYKMSTIEQSDDIWGQIGRVRYDYSGEGDITEVKFGIGWEIFKGFSLGAAGLYYWGDIDRSYSSTVVNNVTGSGVYSATKGNDNYSVSNFKFQAGLQYSVINTDKRMLTLGATYDIGGSLRPRVTKYVYDNDYVQTTVINEGTRSAIRLPQQWVAGIFYQDAHFAGGFDYVRQEWGSSNGSFSETMYGGIKVAYVNTNTFKAGIEYTPNRFDVRHYFNRMAYRAGFRYGDYYQSFGGKRFAQYAVTLGLGFPVRFLGASSVDFGIEIGGRGSHAKITDNIGLIKQQYVKFSIGISMFGDDYWFVRPKYD